MYKKITSISNHIIKNILSNAFPDDMFFVFGEKIIKELCDFDYKIDMLLVLENKIDNLDIKIIQSTNNVILISKEIAAKLCINRKEWIFAAVYKKIDTIPHNYNNAILLENIQHPNNVGLIIRTALALGVDQVFLLNGVNKYNSKLISSSSSYCLSPKVHQIKSISEINLKNKKLISTCCLTSDSIDIRNINKENIKSNWIIVFGNEGNGVSQEIIKLSDLLLNIKMMNNVDSLNVSMCACIVLWEILNNN